MVKVHRHEGSFVGEVSRRLKRSKDPGTPALGYALSTVMTKCGWTRRSTARMDRLVKTLAHFGISSSENLRDLSLPPKHRIYFSTHPLYPEPPIEGTTRQSEKAIESRLGEDLSPIAGPLPYLGGAAVLSGGLQPKRRFTFNGDRHEPDLLLKDTVEGLTVVEIEAARPKHESVSQLDGYIRAVRANEPGTAVAGLLLTYPPRHDAEARIVLQRLAATKRITGASRIDWLWLIRFGRSVELRSPPAS